MNERTMIADELTDDEMTELHTTEDKMTWYDLDPSDIELARRDAMIERGYRRLAAILAGATIVALLVLGVGVLLTRDAQAQDTGMEVTRIINGVPYTWTLPEAGCQLLRGWEDGSSTAWCPSGMFNYDPDGSKDRAPQTWYRVSSTR